MALCAVAAAILISTYSKAAHAEPASDYTLDELRAALETQLQTIRSIRAKYSVSFVAAPGGPGQSWGPDEYEWAQDGDRRFRRSAPSARDAGSVAAFDGQHGFHLVWSSDDRRKGRLTVTDTPYPGLNMAFAPDLPLGLRLQVLPEPVTAVVRLPGARLASRGEIDAGAEWTVEVDGFESIAKVPLHLSLALDARHDFLPRRIALEREGVPFTEWHMVWEVREFMRVADGTAGGKRWFPRTAVFKQIVGEHEMQVAEAAVNLDLPVEQFCPQPSQGMTVVDATREGQNKTYVVGGLRAADKLVRRSAELAKTEIERGPPPERAREVDAAPRRDGWASRAALLSALTLLVAAACLWLRRR